MILATVRMVMPPEKRPEAVRILTRTAERTRVEPGCIACHVYQDAKEPREVLFEEEWRSEEELTHHLSSDHFRNVLLVMEMALEPPEIGFHTIEHSGGVEVIEKARGCRR
jgi:quinol monooxygenase YgiN